MARRYGNYYELLGVPPNASREEIHSAYRRLARRYHPDVNAGRDARARFHELSDAYEVLHDPAERARYNRSMGAQPRTASGAAGPRAQAAGPASAGPRAKAAGPASAGPRVPYFSAPPSPRDVPRFLDVAPGGVGVRVGLGRRVRVQLVLRWLR